MHFALHERRQGRNRDSRRAARQAPGLGRSQWFAGGDSLGRAVEAAISESHYFIALLSLHVANSSWVRKEIRYALKAGKRIIPVHCPALETGALGNCFDDEPLAVTYNRLSPRACTACWPRWNWNSRTRIWRLSRCPALPPPT
ncbi:MAG: toll/interleukin-1 receptor domain-containing protein [Bryobacteraceae bacterium]